MSKIIWSTVVERKYTWHPSMPSRSKPSVECVLSCGHSNFYKGSGEPKGNKLQCRDCTLYGPPKPITPVRNRDAS